LVDRHELEVVRTRAVHVVAPTRRGAVRPRMVSVHVPFAAHEELTVIVAVFAVDRVIEVILVVVPHPVLVSDAYPARELREVWGRTSPAQAAGTVSVTVVAVRAGVT